MSVLFNLRRWVKKSHGSDVGQNRDKREKVNERRGSIKKMAESKTNTWSKGLTHIPLLVSLGETRFTSVAQVGLKYKLYFIYL